MTPNITDITIPAKSALHAGCEGVAAINTIQSVMGVNLKTLRPEPSVEGYTTPGGYSSVAVKPIALAKVNIVNEFAPIISLFIPVLCLNSALAHFAIAAFNRMTGTSFDNRRLPTQWSNGRHCSHIKMQPHTELSVVQSKPSQTTSRTVLPAMNLLFMWCLTGYHIPVAVSRWTFHSGPCIL